MRVYQKRLVWRSKLMNQFAYRFKNQPVLSPPDGFKDAMLNRTASADIDSPLQPQDEIPATASTDPSYWQSAKVKLKLRKIKLQDKQHYPESHQSITANRER